MNKDDKTKALSKSWLKKEKFAREFVLTSDSAVAYIKAFNYTGTRDAARQNGNRMLKNQSVQEMIVAERDELLLNSKVKQEFVLEALLDIIKESKNDKDRNNLLKALDMINKMSGAYNHKQEMDVNGMGFQFNFIKNDTDD